MSKVGEKGEKELGGKGRMGKAGEKEGKNGGNGVGEQDLCEGGRGLCGKGGKEVRIVGMGWVSKICEKEEEDCVGRDIWEGFVRRRDKNGGNGVGEQDL